MLDSRASVGDSFHGYIERCGIRSWDSCSLRSRQGRKCEIKRGKASRLSKRSTPTGPILSHHQHGTMGEGEVDRRVRMFRPDEQERCIRPPSALLQCSGWSLHDMTRARQIDVGTTVASRSSTVLYVSGVAA